jgi:hypothetical protein
VSLDLPRRLTREETDVLAIPIGISRNEFVLTKLSGLRSLPGLLITDGELREWPIEGFFKHENRLYLYGPYLQGTFLAALMQKPYKAVLPFLIRLAQALMLLKRKEVTIDFLQTDSVYFPDSGGVLFLPTALMKEVCNLQPLEHKLRVFECINHPDLRDPEKRVSFSLGVLLYHAIRGEYPFRAETEEEIHNRIRHARLLPLSLIEPGFREELSSKIMAALARGEAPSPTLEQWSEILQSCEREGLYRDIGAAERERIERLAEKERKKAAKAYHRQVFWQKHWKTVAIVAAVVIVSGVVAASLLKNILAPRVTRGYSPRQVVEAFYTSMNDLDHTTMEDCVVDGAGKAVIREVINLYVLSRVSLGYGGRSNIVPANVWDEQGRPALAPPQTVYGVTDLQIVQERGEPDPVFRVSYTKWMPVPQEETDTGSSGSSGGPAANEGAPTYSSQRISERVYLRQDRHDWVIYRFQQLDTP